MARRSPPQPPPSDPLHRDLIAVGLATLGVLMLLTLLLHAGDQAYFGRFVAEGLLRAFGYGAYLVGAVLVALAVYFWLEKTHLSDQRVAVGVGLLFLVLITGIHLPRVHLPDPFALEVVRGGGGYLGAGLAFGLFRTLGYAGSYVVLLGLVLAALLLITQVRVAEALSAAAAALRDLWEREPAPPPPKPRPAVRKRSQPEPAKPPDRWQETMQEIEDPGIVPDPQPEVAARRRRSPDPGPAEQPPLPEMAQSFPASRDHPNYQLPPLSLLQPFDEAADTDDALEETNDRILALEDTLESFGITARVSHYERGPVLTRYEVEPERGIRVAKITSLADDLAMSLAAVDVRVEAPIPGKSAIGIEVPNDVRSTVSLRGVMESPAFRSHHEGLPLALGRDIAGAPIVADLVTMPHLLIAGATGAGKSVCLHSVILSMIMRHTPEEVRFIIIDPKRVEMAVYDGIPHLISPVVHSVKHAADVMRKAIKEMEKRYDRFALKGVTNLSEFNELARLSKESPLEEFEPLPRVVIVVDELADLMMQARAEFEYSICRLAQLARATGIHLVVATQRPSVKIITGNIKANIPSRISFAVASIHDSRTILDGQGAERLIGRGDMLYSPLDAPKPKRIQGSFVPREDIVKIADFLREQGEPEFQIIPETPEDEEDFSEDLETSDEMYQAAVQYVIQEQMASVSMLQRRFKVGYARAGRLVDEMERRGVIGPHEGSKPRQVLIGPGSAYALGIGAEDNGEEYPTCPREDYDDQDGPDE
ncbi:MAG: DNA translocase FtsK [candidate division WS1 bacterium]|nr:DNA translocase FtsK [candidate division WS1 bacterium]